MHIKFISDDPQQPLGDILDEVLIDAIGVRIAVAYCTNRGVDQLEAICRRMESLGGDLSRRVKAVVSVRTPTNLARLAEFADQRPNVLFIHLGRNLPQEEVDRGHFHSKVVAIKRTKDQSTVLVGSHNWTSLALDGHNLEASVRVDCSTSDPFAQQAREHIRRCRLNRACEPFNSNRLDYYKELQRRYAWSVSGSMKPIEEFSRFPTMVLHAEAGDSSLLSAADLQLYLDVNLPKVRGEFTIDRRFRLHLYPNGTMFTETSGSKEEPVLFDGHITMVNTAEDGMVTARPISAVLTPNNLRHPSICSQTVIPASRSPGVQVVVALKSKGTASVPAYHYSSAKPSLRVDVKFEETIHPARRGRNLQWLTPASQRAEKVVESAPVSFERVARVVPPVPLNAEQEAQLRERHRALRGGEVVDYQSAAQRPWFTPWFYAASYVLDNPETEP